METIIKDRVYELLKNIIEHWKIVVYIVCTVGLCWIGVCRSIGNGAQWAAAINCTGLCIFPMILCRINVHRLYKIPYIIWSLLFAVIAYPIYNYFRPNTDYDLSVAFMVINVWIYGLVAIWIATNVRGKQTVFFGIWLLFSVLTVISVNEAFWPVWFLIMMGGFYLAPIDKNGLDEMMLGITKGILISFFWIQGRAFLYRPYDVDPRYMGHFNNVNIAAMFYIVVYVAWLAMLGYARRKEKVSKLECVLCFVFAGSMWDFALLTISRATLLAFCLITILYLFLEEIVTFKTGLKGFFIRGICLFLTFLVMFVPVYACARYIPALRHHPIWYGDYSEEKVHSWDPIDSDKYTSLEEFFTKLIGKTVRTIRQVDSDFAVGTEVGALSDSVYLEDIEPEVSVVSMDDVGFVLEYSDGISPGSDYDHPLMTQYSGNSSGLGFLGGRKYIYRYFLKNLNILGHKEAYPEVYLSGYEFYGHTHNSFLQIAYCFGLPAGVVFIVLIVGTQVSIIIKSVKNQKGLLWNELLPLLLLGIFSLVGMFEMTALLGKFMFISAFLSLIVAMKKQPST